ncbi:hypothetical protein AKO1_007392 [Acrasis kona]|uniref:AP-4 complex subunit epsilon-1 C-terminal domain-containing protein n=1 Tax=Acrasis kona TaxID=1008807 RepID=A0AAW2YSU8_9EUKA
MVVIDCLEDSDDTIRRRTLSLLYTMCNANNVTVIVKKLIEFARRTMDTHMREELIQRISNLAERFCPTIFWYIDTMNTCFEIGSEYVPLRSIQNMVTVIAEGDGTEESIEDDDKMRVYCVDTFYELTEKKPVIHDLHLQVIAWVLGEYGYLSAQHSQIMIVQRLCDLVERQLENHDTKGVVISALMKLIAQTGGKLLDGVQDILSKYMNSKNVDLQQRCYEFQQLVASCTDRNRKPIMDAVLPKDGSCEDIEVDVELSWLKKYVTQAKEMGAREYLHSNQRDQLKEVVNVKRTKELNITPYSQQQPISSYAVDSSKSGSVSTYTEEQKPTSGLDPNILLKKPRRWSEWEDEEDEAPPTLNNNNNNSQSSSSSQYEPSLPSTSNNTFTTQVEEPPKRVVDAKKKKFVAGIFGNTNIDDSATTTKETKKVQVKRRNPSIKKEEIPIITNNVTSENQHQIQSSSSSSISFDQESPQVMTSKKQTTDLISLDELMGNTTPTSYKQLNSPTMREEDDLFSGTTIQHQSSSSISSNDEYHDLFSTPTTTTTTTTASSSKNFLENLWNTAPTLVPQQSLITPPQQVVVEDDDDDDLAKSAFASVLRPQQPRAKTSPIKNNDDMLLLPSNVKRESQLLTLLNQSATRANQQPVGLIKDDLLSVDQIKFWKSDSIVLALVFSTERGYSLTNITCRFQAPTKFLLSFECDAPDVRISNNNTVVIPRLDMGTSVTLLVEMKLSSFGFGLALMGTVMYSDHERQTHNQSLSVQLNVVDVMRPLVVAESEISKLWVGVSNDFIKKTTINSSSYSIQAYVEKLERDLKIKVIQIIGQEAIGAARLINIDEKVLFHGAIKNNGVYFSTKVRDKPTNEILSKFAQKMLAQ